MYQKANPTAAPEPIQELVASTTTSTGGSTAGTGSQTSSGSSFTTSPSTFTTSSAPQTFTADPTVPAAGTTVPAVDTQVSMPQFPVAPAPRANNAVAVNPGSTVFDAASLALHNGTNGTCYIAYNGQVYDVTGNASWVNCMHHGVQGGRDVTSVFPHPVSRLNGIPVVGTYSNGSTGGGTVTPPTTGGDDDEDENEIDDQDESEVQETKDHPDEVDEVDDQETPEVHDSEDVKQSSEHDREEEHVETGLVIQAGAARSTLVA